MVQKMVPIVPPKDILFLDTNICIKIYQAVSKNISYMEMDETLKILKDKNRPNTIIFVFPYLLEGGFRKKEHDYENNMDETLFDAECIKKFFDKSLCDIEILKQYKEVRKKLGIGQSDFQFEKQIIFYKSLRNIIYCGENRKKNINIRTKIIDKARECRLRLYYPIVISAIAVLYQDKNDNAAESFLKLKKKISEGLSTNVVNDMTNILRFSSSSYEFMLKYFRDNFHLCNIEFVTEDLELSRFINCCDIKSLYYLIKGKPKESCPIDRIYFPLASDNDWKYLHNLFSEINI